MNHNEGDPRGDTVFIREIKAEAIRIAYEEWSKTVGPEAWICLHCGRPLARMAIHDPESGWLDGWMCGCEDTWDLDNGCPDVNIIVWSEALEKRLEAFGGLETPPEKRPWVPRWFYDKIKRRPKSS